MDKKVIITAALAGSATFKHQNQAVPYSPAEFAEEAHKAYKAGAAMVHMHARDEAQHGFATANIAKVKDVYDAIKQKSPELIVQITSSVGLAYEDRMAPIIDLKPEMSSLNTNSMNFSVVDRKTGRFILTTFSPTRSPCCGISAEKWKNWGSNRRPKFMISAGLIAGHLLTNREFSSRHIVLTSSGGCRWHEVPSRSFRVARIQPAAQFHL